MMQVLPCLRHVVVRTLSGHGHSHQLRSPRRIKVNINKSVNNNTAGTLAYSFLTPIIHSYSHHHRTLCSTPKLISKPRTFPLTQREEKVFRILRTVVERRRQARGTVLRVAGGWVRDKLWGLQSDDMDIAIDRMTGAQLLSHIRGHLRYVKQEELLRGAGVVRINPEQSKHLETVAMQLCNVDLDLVNLRAEDYASDSRIPTMRIGTPLEDALRRDFTINSLFYNINEDIVEDFTGQGFDDMDAKLLRTPLPALKTLMDDPLRLLRAIRFASRFGLSLDSELEESLSDPNVHRELCMKVSSERIGIEVRKMTNTLQGFQHAVQMMHSSGVMPFGIAILHGTNADGFFEHMKAHQRGTTVRSVHQQRFDMCSSKQDSIVLNHSEIGTACKRMTFCSTLEQTDQVSDVHAIGMALLLSSFSDHAENGNDPPMQNVMSWQQCVAPTRTHILNSMQLSLALLLKYSTKESSVPVRILRAAWMLRDLGDWHNTCERYGDAMNVLKLVSEPHLSAAVHVACAWDIHHNSTQEDIDACKQRVNSMYDALHSTGVVNVYSTSPLVDGNDIMKHFPIKGRAIGDILQIAFQYQLRYNVSCSKDVLDFLDTCPDVQHYIAEATKSKK
jgi:tRNA nucleotidyltransferase/poly(A) polymerase